MNLLESHNARTTTAVKITNYRMALGRIGLACVFLPILTALGVLLLVDRDGNPAIGVGLLLGCLPFLWYALTVPLVVRIDDQLMVRYLLFRRCWPTADIRNIQFGSIRTQFGPGRLLPGHELGVRSWQSATLILTSGTRVRFLVNDEAIRQLRKYSNSESTVSR